MANGNISNSKKSGRPRGAKNEDRASAVSLPPACPSCNSTRREPYRNGVVVDRQLAGEIDGRPYNRVVWRRTRCLDCGQQITVREYHFSPTDDDVLCQADCEIPAQEEVEGHISREMSEKISDNPISGDEFRPDSAAD
jgi:hypothetical protein